MALELRAPSGTGPVGDAGPLTWSQEGSRLHLGGGGSVLPAHGLPLPDGDVDEVRWPAPHLLGRPQRLAWLRECRRVLRPGGCLVVDEHAAATLDLDRDASATGLEPPLVGDDRTHRLTAPARRRRQQPLVSVLIAGYRPDFLDEALRSARAQSWTALEILVGVDGPQADALRSIVAAHTDLDDRVHDVGPPPEPGGRGNYLHLLEQARGAYVKFLNDDDLLEPRAVEMMAACLSELPNVTLVSAHRRPVDRRGSPLPDDHATIRRVAHDAVIPGPAAARDLATRSVNWIGEPTSTMFRAADLRGEFPFAVDREPAIANGDFALWLTLLGRGDLVYLPTTLSSFRRHEDQVSVDPEFRRRAGEGMRRLCAAAERIGLTDDVGSRWQVQSLDVKPWWSARTRDAVEQIGISSPPEDVEALRWHLNDDRLHRLCVAQLALADDRPHDADEALADTAADDLSGLKTRALARLLLGRIDDATADLRAVLAACPTDPEAIELHHRLRAG